jgi:5-methylcytosine-specific restriction endonuclease McrA
MPEEVRFDDVFSLKTLRQRIIVRDARTCQYCGKSGLYGKQLTLDHIRPVCLGGQDTPDNLLVACKQCNHRKNKKLASTYVAQRIQQLERELEQLRKLEPKQNRAVA